MIKIPHDPDEELAIVDENDKVIGHAPRREIHQKGLRHREVAVVIINSKGQILSQRREDNKKYTCSAAGHFHYLQSYKEAAVREVEEELGIQVSLDDLNEHVVYCFDLDPMKNHKNAVFYRIYIHKADIQLEDIKIDTGEVDSVKYFAKEGLIKMMQEDPSQFSRGFGKFIINYVAGRL